MKAEGQHQEIQSRTIKLALQKDPQGAYMVDNRNTPQMQLMDMIQRVESKTPQFVDNRDNSQIRLMKAIQCMGMEEEEDLQMKPVVQLQSEDEELQLKPITQLQSEDDELLQGKFEPIQQKPNNTGLPDNLKSGVESMSGFSMDDVKVHYNSSKPAQMHAHAYAQGTNIYVAPGQEKHLPHEA